MVRLRKFVIISLACHLVLILAMVEVNWRGRKIDPAAVYEVAIVAGVPAAGSGSGSPETVSMPQGKRFIYTRGAKTASIGEVRKEQGGKEQAPEFSPSDIKPEAPADAPDMPDAASLIKGQTKGSPGGGTGRGPAGGIPSEIAIWKGRVRGMVEALWRTPPEIDEMDTSLQTTYLLRVGRAGELLQKKLLVSSGNVPFDRSVLVALGKISRFPQPPLVLIAGGDWVEVTMSFTPPKGARQ
jgi:hypothetical protein